MPPSAAHALPPTAEPLPRRPYRWERRASIPPPPPLCPPTRATQTPTGRRSGTRRAEAAPCCGRSSGGRRRPAGAHTPCCCSLCAPATLQDFKADHSDPNIDFTAIHIWPDLWKCQTCELGGGAAPVLRTAAPLLPLLLLLLPPHLPLPLHCQPASPSHHAHPHGLRQAPRRCRLSLYSGTSSSTSRVRPRWCVGGRAGPGSCCWRPAAVPRLNRMPLHPRPAPPPPCPALPAPRLGGAGQATAAGRVWGAGQPRRLLSSRV